MCAVGVKTPFLSHTIMTSMGMWYAKRAWTDAVGMFLIGKGGQYGKV